MNVIILKATMIKSLTSHILSDISQSDTLPAYIPALNNPRMFPNKISAIAYFMVPLKAWGSP